MIFLPLVSTEVEALEAAAGNEALPTATYPFRFNTFDYPFVLLLALIMFLPLALTMSLPSYRPPVRFLERVSLETA